MQGAEESTFDLADADREAATGEFVVEEAEQVEQDTNADNEDESDEGEEELEPKSDSDTDTDSGGSDDPVDVGEY